LIGAADHHAHALGLRVGQTVAQGQALVPNLHVVDAMVDKDEAALVELARWCIGYSPVVAPCPPDGIWIDIAGSADLFGGEEALVADLLQRLAAQNIHARASVADAPGAAWAMARYGHHIIVPPGESMAAVAELSVAALRLPQPIVEGLNRLGIDRIGQLAAMPRAPMTSRFCREVGMSLDQAHGHVFEPLNPMVPKETPSRRLVFAEPIGRLDDLKHVLNRLAVSLCADLARQDLGVRRLDLIFERIDRRNVALRIGTAQATREAHHLARLFDERLQLVDPGFGIEAAVLAASKVEPLSAHQVEARDFRSGDVTVVDLGRLVDRLGARLGPRRIYRMQPVESHIPERSVKRVPALAPVSGKAWPDALPRPSRLLKHPELVTATALMPDHPPAFFIWRRVRHRVIKADGPERIVGEWWRRDEDDFDLRDYYRVEDEKGARFWLFRDAPADQSARWWLHGIFA
jgi:protein ImuB